MHRSGFINIIGNPNVGKSTLMNALIGERMSIINRKPQTTRHRIIGIVSGDDYQMVFSDTPGLIDDPQYALHLSMNKAVMQTFEDADVMIYLTTIYDPPESVDAFFSGIGKVDCPVFLVINKCDLGDPGDIESLIVQYEQQDHYDQVFSISALHKTGTERLMQAIEAAIPEGPPYYPKDQLSDRPERFFITEIIREKILTFYHKEIPYSCQVEIETFEEEEGRKGPFTRIRALIYVNRQTQKSIIIGKGGEAIKRVGIHARKDIEVFLERQVHLELFVKVRDNWRDDEKALRRFGY